jgi:folate-dependent phosphoribosylglycinamide formyltransferase PurN
MVEEIVKKIYDGKPEDFRWAGFGSGSGTNLRECAKAIPPALIFTDRPKATLFRWDELKDVPRIVMNGYKACGSWRKAQGNPEELAIYEGRSIAFNEELLLQLREFERKEGPIDLIVLGGYMRLIKEPLLEGYKDKIINVHPSALPANVVDGSLVEGEERLYVGDDAVYDAIKAGKQFTKSSVIMVDDKVDHGEILTQGPEVEVWYEILAGTQAEKDEAIREYADAHQSLQKVRSDWPALTMALKLISAGRIALGTEKVHHNEWRQVYLDEKPLPYEGFQLNLIE